jgi:hypothetical protein
MHATPLSTQRLAPFSLSLLLCLGLLAAAGSAQVSLPAAGERAPSSSHALYAPLAGMQDFEIGILSCSTALS